MTLLHRLNQKDRSSSARNMSEVGTASRTRPVAAQGTRLTFNSAAWRCRPLPLRAWVAPVDGVEPLGLCPCSLLPAVLCRATSCETRRAATRCGPTRARRRPGAGACAAPARFRPTGKCYDGAHGECAAAGGLQRPGGYARGRTPVRYIQSASAPGASRGTARASPALSSG